MKNDDIILLAIEHTINGLKFNEEGLLRFAKLIAEHEREACAKICDGYSDGRHANMADLCAEGIRERNKQ